MDLNLSNNKDFKRENFISQFINELKNALNKEKKNSIGILDRIQNL